MIDHFPLPVQGKPERRHLYRWIKGEEEYAHAKFDADGNGAQREDHDKGMISYDLDGWWIRQIVQYLDRAKLEFEAAKHLRGIEDSESAERHEKKAQQAICKCMMTVKGCAESSIRIFGPLPHPGIPSGEVKPWMTGAVLLEREIAAKNG